MDTEGALNRLDSYANASVEADEVAMGIVRRHIAEAYLGQWGSERVIEHVRERIDWLARHVRGKTILDIGSSEGVLALVLAQEGCCVTSLSASTDAVSVVERVLEQESEDVRKRLHFKTASLLDEDLSGSFDTIVIGGVGELLDDLGTVIQKAEKCLTHAGRLIVLAPLGLLPSVDESRTFLLSRLVVAVQSRLKIEHLSVESGQVRLVSCRLNVNSCDDPSDDATVTTADLIELTGRALLETQRKFQAVSDAREGKIKRLSAEIERLQRINESGQGDGARPGEE